MELLTLNSNYQPANLVERYASLIWTERYFTAGDFQLVSTDVERMLNLLPLESMVTIRESTVPMIVEVHRIEKSKSGAPVLTITGRSFDSVLERRVAAKGDISANLPREGWLEVANKSSDAAYQAIRKILGDVERNINGVILPAVSPQLSPNDALPMVDLIPPDDYILEVDDGIDPPSPSFEIKPGNLYDTVMELVAAKHHGLKAVRPLSGNNKIGLEIYNGADLTNHVAFNAKFDQFDDSTYLLSYAGLTNWAYVYSKSASQTVDKTQATVDEPIGLERRVLYLDVSSEEGTDSEAARNTRGLVELYKYNATALFDGHISDQIASLYNDLDNGYFLGDIIRLDGEYGLSRNVRVSEFIRSDDSSGSRAYPTFETVTE